MGVLNQFEDSDGLSFQIMPNPDGLELYVTRIVDMGDESTDERMVRNIVDTIQHSLTDRIGKKRKEDKEEGKISPKPVINTEDKSSTLKPIDVTVVFEDFEDFVSMAKETAGEFDQSVLYRYSGHYFLHVFHQVEKPEEVASKNGACSRVCRVLKNFMGSLERIRRSHYAGSCLGNRQTIFLKPKRVEQSTLFLIQRSNQNE